MGRGWMSQTLGDWIQITQLCSPLILKGAADPFSEECRHSSVCVCVCVRVRVRVRVRVCVCV